MASLWVCCPPVYMQGRSDASKAHLEVDLAGTADGHDARRARPPAWASPTTSFASGPFRLSSAGNPSSSDLGSTGRAHTLFSSGPRRAYRASPKMAPLLSFHRQIIEEIAPPEHDDLLILAKGLGLRKILCTMMKIYDSEHNLVLLVSCLS